MKGKKILALTSIFAGVALVGATFAAWAVTDNAAAFNVTISPGSISSDTTTNPVTLSYGQRSFANVGNIVSGTKRQAASVQLTADWEVNNSTPELLEETSTFTGQFTVTLNQETDKTTKLIDYLKVYVCNDEPTLGTGTLVSEMPASANQKLVLEGNAESKTASLDVTITRDNNVPVPVSLWVVVEYLEVSSAIVDQLSSQQVTLTMDWGKTGAGTVTSFDEIYYYGPDTNVNVYAWKADKTNNGAWPGKDMTLVRDDGTNKLYKYILPNDNYTGFLLVNDSETKLTAEDVTLATWRTAGHECWVYENSAWGWGEIPSKPVTLTKDYYLVGSFSNWSPVEDNGLTKVTDGEYTITKQLAADDELKVVSKDGNTWFTDASVDWLNGLVGLAGDNVKILADGNYDITFYVNSDYGNHIKVATHAA